MYAFTHLIFRPFKAFGGKLLVTPRTTIAGEPGLHQHHLSSRSLTISATGSSQSPRMPAVLRPVVPSPELLQFTVEDKAQARSDIFKSVMNYVRMNNLQDPDDKRIINCDKKLQAIFGVETCSIAEVNRHLVPHIRKPQEVGGRYLKEAKLVEDIYVERKRLETKTKRRKQNDKKSNRKLPPFQPLVLSDELAVICRSKEMTRPDVLKAVWRYIRLNHLQKKQGEPVRCDFLLKKVFQKDEVNARSIMKGISVHVSKKN